MAQLSNLSDPPSPSGTMWCASKAPLALPSTTS